MEAYMEVPFCTQKTVKNTEAEIRDAATQSMLAIQAKEMAVRDAKRVLEDNGVFDTMEKAKNYVREKAETSDYPLYVTKDEESEKYLVKEYVLKDMDGIPVHNGDTVFFADDSFAIILFRYNEDSKMETTDRIFVKFQKVENFEDFYPEWFSEGTTYWMERIHHEREEQRTIFSFFYTASSELISQKSNYYRLRAWMNEEKITYLQKEMEEVAEKASNEYNQSKRAFIFGTFVAILGLICMAAIFPLGFMTIKMKSTFFLMATVFLPIIGYGIIAFSDPDIPIKHFIDSKEKVERIRRELVKTNQKLETMRETVIGRKDFGKLLEMWESYHYVL